MTIMTAWRHEESVFRYLHLAMFLLYLLLSGFIISMNPEQRLLIAGGCILLLLLMVIRHVVLSNHSLPVLQMLFPFLEGFVIGWLTIRGEGSFGLSLFMLLAWDIALDTDKRYAIPFITLVYAVYMFIYFQHVPAQTLFGMLILLGIAAFQYMLFTVFAFLAKDYNSQRRELKETTAQLHARMISNEETTLLRERNRIALEIHNTVGHQLTTALVQMEAAQLVMDNNHEEARQRLVIVREQIREGLMQIRKAVTAVEAEEEYEDLQAAVEKLVAKVRMLAGVEVSCDIGDLGELRIGLKKILMHVLMEGMTNAIRHAQCRRIEVVLVREGSFVRLSCINDGRVPDALIEGYGLSRMREQLQSIGGTLLAGKDRNGCFSLHAEAPVYFRTLVPEMGIFPVVKGDTDCLSEGGNQHG